METGYGGNTNEGEEVIQKTMKGETGEEGEGMQVDPDAVAFIRAKKKVDDLNKAKKFEKKTA